MLFEVIHCKPECIKEMLIEYKIKLNRAQMSVDSGLLVKSRVQSKHGEVGFRCYAAHKWSARSVSAFNCSFVLFF